MAPAAPTWAEKLSDQEFPGPCPPRHNNNVIKCEFVEVAGSPGARRQGMLRGQSQCCSPRTELAGLLPAVPGAELTSTPQPYSTLCSNIMDLQGLVLCGLYVLNMQTIKQKLIKQEGTGEGRIQ